MTYPDAPWKLKGYAILALQLIDIDRLRPLIPPELEIVSVWPGKTVGAVYLSYYGSGSVLEYSELIVAAGLVRHSGQIGGWVSHIYVDNPDSVAGGREIWGLPKELADFTWKKGEQPSVIVRQGSRTLCKLDYSRQSFGLRQQLGFPSFSTLDSNLLLFNAEFGSQLSFISSKLEVPTESPFAGLNLAQPWLTVSSEDLDLAISAPKVIGKTSAEFSYR